MRQTDKNKKPKLTKEEKLAWKEQRHKQRLEQKRLRAESMFTRKQGSKAPINVGKKPILEEEKFSREKTSYFERKAAKPPRKPFNFKLALREFPIKVTKEISRIHWSKKSGLGKKFIIVILFVLFFAIFYFALDALLVYVLGAAHII